MGPYLIRSVLTASFVNFVLTLPHNQKGYEAVTNKVNGDSETQKNFHNLFNSISKNDATNGDVYRQILRREVSEEQLNFGALKEDLQNTRARNRFTNKQKNSDNIALAKRETSEKSSDTATAEHLVSDSLVQNVFETLFHLWSSQLGFIQKARVLFAELRRTKFVYPSRVNDQITTIERRILEQIELLRPFLNAPGGPEDLKKVLDKNVFVQGLKDWLAVDEFLGIYQLEGAHMEGRAIQDVFKAGLVDLHRRWQQVEYRLLELEEHQEDKEYAQCHA